MWKAPRRRRFLAPLDEKGKEGKGCYYTDREEEQMDAEEKNGSAAFVGEGGEGGRSSINRGTYGRGGVAELTKQSNPPTKGKRKGVRFESCSPQPPLFFCKWQKEG